MIGKQKRLRRAPLLAITTLALLAIASAALADLTPPPDATAADTNPRASTYQPKPERARPRKRARLAAAPAAPVPQPTPALTVAIPRSQIQLREVETKPRPPRQYEVSASNWTPSHVGEVSFLSDSSEFHATALPQISVNLLSSGWQNNSLHLSAEFGISYTQLEREGNLQFGNQDKTFHQSMNLFSFRAGLLLASATPLLGFVEPYFALAALPTWASTPASPFNSGTSKTLTAMEFATGVALPVDALAETLGTDRFAVIVGLLATIGALDSAYSGVGATAGARVSL